MKILISAFACAPNAGGEYGRSWNIITRLAKNHQVWVITTPAFRAEIESVLKQTPAPNLHIEYLESVYNRWLVNKLRRAPLVRPIIANLDYYFWQLALYPLALRLQRENQFDITQHISYIRYWTPSLLALLPVPFVWGTVGGAEIVPREMLKALSWRGHLLENLRLVAQNLAELDPLVGLTARRSAAALSMTARTTERLKRLRAPHIIEAQDSGMGIGSSADQAALYNLQRPASTSVLRFVSVGRLIECKAHFLAILAFARLANRHQNVEYWLVGDGFERLKLHQLCKNLGLEERVHFTGLVPRAQVFATLGQSAILVHPSLRESGSIAILEGLAAGLPVICMDISDPLWMVDAKSGFRVPAREPQQVIEDMANAMLTLVEDSVLRESMGAAARERSKLFSWDITVNHFEKTYQQILARNS